MLYHVSPTPGITVLEPRVSSHGKAWVYATPSLVTGLLFGVRHDDFDLRISTLEDGRTEVCECYPGAFQRVYQGKSCTVYHVSEDGFLQGQTSWTAEWVCPDPVRVKDSEMVEDIHQRLMQEVEQGNMVLRLWSEDAAYKAMIAQHVVDRLIRFNALDVIRKDPIRGPHFARLIAALEQAMNGDLLTGNMDTH